MFNRLLRLGGRNFFVAGAGTQSIFNEETGLTEEQRVGRGTCDMLTKPNEIEGSERLLAVPIYIHIDPFSKANETIPVHPQPTPFAILEPTYLRKPSDVHGMMSDIVKVGNELKPENSPEITYDLPGPDWAHRKRPTPKLITSHKV